MCCFFRHASQLESAVSSSGMSVHRNGMMVDNLTKSPMKSKSVDKNSANSATKYHKHRSLSGNVSNMLGFILHLGPISLSDVLRKFDCYVSLPEGNMNPSFFRSLRPAGLFDTEHFQLSPKISGT